MSERWKGAIPRTARDVADNLDLWAKAERIACDAFFRRAVSRGAATIRELADERDRLAARVQELEGERELATWRRDGP